MTGDIQAARRLGDSAEARLRELNDGPSIDELASDLERAIGDHEALAERLRLSNDYEAERGATALLGTYGPLRARALCQLGRHDEAERLVAETRGFAPPDDPIGQSLWRQATALVRSHHGEHAEAERLTREALVLAQTTDSPGFQADVFWDLATVLEAAGRGDEADAALREALALYERKQTVPLAQRTRDRLAALQPAQT
jgi:tetratricopeptide (TPR) repeat protein